MARIFKGWRTSLVVQCRQVVVTMSRKDCRNDRWTDKRTHVRMTPVKSCFDENGSITNIDQLIYKQNVPLFTISTRHVARIFHWLKISPVVFGDQMRKDGLNDRGTNKRTCVKITQLQMLWWKWIGWKYCYIYKMCSCFQRSNRPTWLQIFWGFSASGQQEAWSHSGMIDGHLSKWPSCKCSDGNELVENVI